MKASGTGWYYKWAANGMLMRVVNPEKGIINFGYDPLGRRTTKTVKDNIYHYLWDGNVILHEWVETKEEAKIKFVTWVYEDGSFIPVAKIQNNENYSIVTDYHGTPAEAYDTDGNKVWERELDIYGRVRKENLSNFVPFKYQGMYEDCETGLCYCRHRYYDPSIGSFISQDPIRLAGNNPTLYTYVKDVNTWIDPFGLDVYVLTASSDGWYPVYEKGQLDPTSYTKLKKGDIYKIGESQRSSKRYSSTMLDEARINRSTATSVAIDVNGKVIPNTTAGLRMEVIDSGGTKQADRLLETQKLKDYEKTHGDLPAGNKTHH